MNAGGCADPGGCEDADKHLYEYQHHELTPTSISASRTISMRVGTVRSCTARKRSFAVRSRSVPVRLPGTTAHTRHLADRDVPDHPLPRPWAVVPNLTRAECCALVPLAFGRGQPAVVSQALGRRP